MTTEKTQRSIVDFEAGTDSTFVPVQIQKTLNEKSTGHGEWNEHEQHSQWEFYRFQRTSIDERVKSECRWEWGCPTAQLPQWLELPTDQLTKLLNVPWDLLTLLEVHNNSNIFWNLRSNFQNQSLNRLKEDWSRCNFARWIRICIILWVRVEIKREMTERSNSWPNKSMTVQKWNFASDLENESMNRCEKDGTACSFSRSIRICVAIKFTNKIRRRQWQKKTC